MIFNERKSSFIESAQIEHSNNYCLSSTQHSQSESGESINFIEKSNLRK
jgi:hypothetical protein